MRYSHAADHHPARIREVDWLFEDDVKFLKIKLPVKIRDILKIEKRNSIATSAFHHENKKYPIYVPKKIFEEKRWFIIDRKKTKGTMFLSMISIQSYMIIHYIAEKMFLMLFFTGFQYRRNFKKSGQWML